MNNRPKFAGHFTTTPKSGTIFRLLGSGLRSGAITLTRDETAALNKLYGFEPEKPTKKPPKPHLKAVEVEPNAPEWKRRDAEAKAKKDHEEAVKRWEKWEDPQPLMQAGADRNMIRHAEHDGMRLVAWLAKFVPKGEDPLRRSSRSFRMPGTTLTPSTSRGRRPSTTKRPPNKFDLFPERR